MESEKKLSDQLNNDIWDKEKEMNREYSGNPKKVMSILISPKTFHELASEKDIWDKILVLRISEGWHYFNGIPLLITSDVERWELRV